MRLVGLLAACVLLSVGVPAVRGVPSAAQEGQRPNVLIIVTDDQRGGLEVMPATSKRFMKQGTRYSPAFATTPVCCPARASIMTGRYAHNHGVRSNSNEEETGADHLDHSTTLQRYLNDAGYRTGIVGKFLNPPWRFADNPPYFDEWATVGGTENPSGLGWFDTTFNVNGDATPTKGYITTVMRRRAVNFIRRNSGETPWYLYIGTRAPHPPAPAQPRYERMRVQKWGGNPAVFEEDKSDKPLYVQKRHRGLAHANKTRRAQFRTLASVDDMVEAIFEQLAEEDERDTLVFFISDNGLGWSEHGIGGKGNPYKGSTRVPMLARWPGHIAKGMKDRRWAANIDIAPTILDAVGVAPQTPMDGRSLLRPWKRDRILLEFWCNSETQVCNRWASTQTRQHQYTEYYEEGETVFREFYDSSDRWQLENLLGNDDPRDDPDTTAIEAQLQADRKCVGVSCP